MERSAAGLLLSVLFFGLLHERAGAALSLETFVRRPKLVVVVVIDQFRADYLTRFESRFLPSGNKPGQWGGFKYLMKGAYFPYADYEHLQTTTCPGHATILTGAYPYNHRIAINDWYDPLNGKDVYCVADDEAKLVGTAEEGRSGASPKLLKSTTVGDELKAAGHGSRVIGISLKDRSAILLGGHRADLALWFDGNGFKWISSQYYLKENRLPSWVEKLNGEIASRRGTKREWKSAGSGTGLSIAKNDFFRETIVGTSDSLTSPVGLELTTDAALAAVKAYGLGSRSSPDVLAISYSTHDSLGHRKGPNSREMEELTIAEDRTLAELFKGLDRSVPGGMKNVLVVLTADHGVAPDRAQLKTERIESDGIDSEELMARLNQELEKKFGPAGEGKKWLVRTRTFNFYFDRKLVQEKKLDQKDLENEVKTLLLKEPGVAAVLTRSEYLGGRFPPGLHGHQARLTYILDQSGDVLMIPKAFYAEAKDVFAHMTGYSYDRTVPLAFAGTNIESGVHPDQVRVVDLAPTLSFLLGILPPAHSEGRVLSQAIRQNK